MSDVAVYLGAPSTPALAAAVVEGGGVLTEHVAAASAIVWPSADVEGLRAALHPGIRWVQLPDSGVDRWIAEGLVDGRRVFTSARGCYGAQVAEHALALMLACARRLKECAGASTWPAADHRPTGSSLDGATVMVVGAGDIGARLVAMLAPLGPRVIAVTRDGRSVPGAHEHLRFEDLDLGLGRADQVVLCTPSTAETVGMIDAKRLAAMPRGSFVVNVGRGDLIVTEELVESVLDGHLGGAGLDVTDPEPLPAGHPLWSLPTVLITPHVANPPEAKDATLARRVEENTRRFVDGRELVSVIDVQRGY